MASDNEESAVAQKGPRERHRTVALHHAQLLQQRKDVEMQVFEALEELIESPLTVHRGEGDVAATKPASSDLAAVRTRLRIFQISDYDALLEERNLAGKCAYVFCPNNVTSRTQGMRILGSRIVEARDVRAWCSGPAGFCARGAMFIKAQLSEVPAWERAGGMGSDVQVLVSGGKGVQPAVSAVKPNARVSATEMAQLLPTAQEAVAAQFLVSDVVGKDKLAPPREPLAHDGPHDAFAVEGFAPKPPAEWAAAREGKRKSLDVDWDLG